MFKRIDYKKNGLKMVLIMLYLEDKPKVIKAIENLLSIGYSEKGIVYTLSKREVQEKIEQHIKNESLLAFIIDNEVKKIAFKNKPKG